MTGFDDQILRLRLRSAQDDKVPHRPPSYRIAPHYTPLPLPNIAGIKNNTHKMVCGWYRCGVEQKSIAGIKNNTRDMRGNLRMRRALGVAVGILLYTRKSVGQCAV